MLGKASEIKVRNVEPRQFSDIETDINEVLEGNPSWDVLDIKFSIMTNGENINEVYREALIIYKEHVEINKPTGVEPKW